MFPVVMHKRAGVCVAFRIKTIPIRPPDRLGVKICSLVVLYIGRWSWYLTGRFCICGPRTAWLCIGHPVARSGLGKQGRHFVAVVVILCWMPSVNPLLPLATHRHYTHASLSQHLPPRHLYPPCLMLPAYPLYAVTELCMIHAYLR